MKNKLIIKTITYLALLFSLIFAGSNATGNSLARAKNSHSGNKVRTTFYNYGLVGRWMSEPDDIGGEWPINSGHEYIGDVGHLVGAEFKDNSGNLKKSVITIDSPRGSEYNLDTHWGWEPLPGYTNLDTPLVAMSHMGPSEDDPNATHTWPDQWPDKLEDPLDPGWPGTWNGYFGKDQKNAEQESFFIMDDSKDSEFEYYPDSTDFERRGLGLTCTIRGLQWNHILAEDVLFWLYDIKNESNYDLDKMVFGYIVGTITGGDGDSQDDWADFDKADDIAYSYDNGTDLETGLGGVGANGWSPVGLAGYAFLESPGNPFDGIDNDGDGSAYPGYELNEDVFAPISFLPGDSVIVINYDTYERSIVNMPADSLVINKNGTTLIYTTGEILEEIPRNLIDDNLNGLIDENNGASIETSPGFFEDFYLYFDPLEETGLKYVNYFDGVGLDNLLIDESREDGIDNDGDWDPTTDDVGIDGLPGSGDLGENDGLPTSGAGTDLPGEPNIDKTDIDESDQIGLSSFYYFNFGVGPQMNGDARLWDEMLPGYFNNSVQNTDADFLFSSGYFPLKEGQTERFSVALLFGDNLPDLVRNKQTVQTIYNQNYNFAKAPELPRIWAFAGDGYVTLYWDDKAEYSVDRITGDDFEGYKIYKATDTRWTDSGTITDAFGSPKFNVPIKQYDLINEYEGFFPGHVDGIQFYLGSNNGLVHSWTDTNVINGHQYFYAVSAYDHGSIEKAILPAETSKFVTMDKGGKVITAKNVAAVTPDAPVAGYILPPKNEQVYPITSVRGTGSISINNLDPNKILDAHIYRIQFLDTRMNGFDDDGDWSPDTHDVGIDGCLDIFEDGLGGCLNSENNGETDPNNDNWFDCGADGLCDEFEPGYDIISNPDPNGDNYDYNQNPHGSESNLKYDLGEGTEGNQYPDSGEPNLDEGDIDEAIPMTTHFRVLDVTESLTNPDTVVSWLSSLDGDLGQFDGMVLDIENHWGIKKDVEKISFSPSQDVDYTIDYAPFVFGGIKTEGVAYPRDIALVFSDTAEYVTSSVTLEKTNGQSITLPQRNVNFKIVDLFDDTTAIEYAVIDRTWDYYGMDPTLIEDSLFNETFYYNPDDFDYYEVIDTADGTWSDFGFAKSAFGPHKAIQLRFAADGHFSYADRIIVLESTMDTLLVSWNITPGNDNIPFQHAPTLGDSLKLYCTKPFTHDDQFEFVSTAARHDISKMFDELKKVKVVPNPYIVGASWEGQNPYASGRGPRSLHFNHLPPDCEIKIFTLAGELVNTLYHQSGIHDGSLEWNMLTKDNLDIAYGIYFYHIQPIDNSSNQFESILGKFAVIK